MKKLRHTVSAESKSTTIRAPQGVTVVLTVPVDGARLARTVAIQWHRTREGLSKTDAPPADGVTTITYNFAADQPGTFTYHARYSRDLARAAGSLVDVRGSEAGPSTGGLARTLAGPSAGRRAPTAGPVDVRGSEAGQPAGDRARTKAWPMPSAGSRAPMPPRHGGAVDVPRRDDGRAAVPRRHRQGDGVARWGRGRGSVVAQMMGDCPVVYYDDAEYDGGASVLVLLRRTTAALAAAALWVSGICGPRDPDMMHRRGS